MKAGKNEEFKMKEKKILKAQIIRCSDILQN